MTSKVLLIIYMNPIFSHQYISYIVVDHKEILVQIGNNRVQKTQSGSLKMLFVSFFALVLIYRVSLNYLP
jgi:hypothetical protein